MNKKINLYRFISQYPFRDFFKKQLFYTVNPIAHFKEEIINEEIYTKRVEIIDETYIRLLDKSFEEEIETTFTKYILEEKNNTPKVLNLFDEKLLRLCS